MSATSPWTPGARGGWWPEDSATPAATSTPPWLAGPAPARRPDDTLTDELEPVRADAPDPAPPARPTPAEPTPPAAAEPRTVAPTPPATPTPSTAGTPAVKPTPPAAKTPPATPAPPTAAPTAPTPPATPAAPVSPAVEPSPEAVEPGPLAAALTEPTPLVPASDEDAATFWLPVEESTPDGSGWPARRMRGGRRPATSGMSSGPRPRPRKPPKPPRSAAAGLASLVLLSLLAAFFAWVSAEPLWLAIGHRESGTATVTRCTGSGVQQRCVGTFTGGGFTRERVRLLGVDGDQRAEGTRVEAQMVGRGADSAYVGTAAGPLHLRWGLGLGLVLLCGLGIVWGTGALRLDDRRSRRRATLTALGAPVLVAIGFFAAAF